MKVGEVPEDKREYTFYLSNEDLAVRRMIVKRGHKISMVPDGDWDVALFTGGADVMPILYGERMHPSVSCNVTRDLNEVSFYRSLHHKRMKVGICRGAQLLNVLSGGRLWQHVNGHNSVNGHLIKLYDQPNQFINVSSRHHQLMIPGSEAWVMGQAKEATTLVNERDGQKDHTKETREKEGYTDCEICYYGNSHSLCFQPHPEDADNGCQDLFFNMIDYMWDDKMHQQSLMGWD